MVSSVGEHDQDLMPSSFIPMNNVLLYPTMICLLKFDFAG